MTLMSAPRLNAPLVTTESGLVVPAGFVDRDAVGGGGGGLISFVDHLEYLNPGTATVDLTIPAAAQAGDLLVAGAAGYANAGTDAPGGAGYTALGYGSNTNAASEVWWREVGAGEPGTDETWTAVTNRMMIFFMFVIRNANVSDPISDSSIYSSGPDTQYMRAPAITPVDDGCLVLNLYARDQATGTDDTGYPSSYTGIFKDFGSYGGRATNVGCCYLVQETAALISEELYTVNSVAGYRYSRSWAFKPA